MIVEERRRRWNDDIVDHLSKVTPPGTVGWELYLQLSERTVFEEVADVIATEPLFAAEMLRYSNTAQFGAGEVVSIVEALNLVGIQRLRRFSLTYALRTMASSDLLPYGISCEEFRLKSVVCAAAMEYIVGDEEGGANAYSVGLLHAIGELFISQAILDTDTNDSLHLKGMAPRKLAVVERGIFGMHQAQVAGLVLRRWHLPECIVAPIEKQFSSDEDERLMDVIQVLSMGRYVGEKILQCHRSERPVSSFKDTLTFRRKYLNDIFEYAQREADALLSKGVA